MPLLAAYAHFPDGSQDLLQFLRLLAQEYIFALKAVVCPWAFVSRQQKEKLHNLEHDQVIEQTQQLQETLLTGPEILDAFDEELFCELIDRITVQSNTQVRFRLKNGLEMTESMERTVR